VKGQGRDHMWSNRYFEKYFLTYLRNAGTHLTLRLHVMQRMVLTMPSVRQFLCLSVIWPTLTHVAVAQSLCDS